MSDRPASAFLITVIDEIHDPEAYERYRERVPSLVDRYGGRYVVRSTDAELIEGDRAPRRVLVVSFPDRKSVRAMFADPEYVEIAGLRQRGTTGRILVVDGA